MVVCGGVDVLCEIEALQDVQKFNGLCIARLVNVDVEVTKEENGKIKIVYKINFTHAT